MTRPLELLLRRLRAIGEVDVIDEAKIKSLPVRSVRLNRGDEIVAEGENSSSCCLVVEGVVHRSKILPNGSRQIFSLHIPGDIPDLHSLHLKEMDHSVVATTRCEVAFITHDAISALLATSADLTGLFWRDTLIDAAAFRAWMLMIGQAEAPARMAHLFCELFLRCEMVGLTQANSFPLGISQGDLADMLGTSSVHANRTLQDLRSRGLVEFDNGRVSIPDWTALSRFGLFDSSYLHAITNRNRTEKL